MFEPVLDYLHRFAQLHLVTLIFCNVMRFQTQQPNAFNVCKQVCVTK